MKISHKSITFLFLLGTYLLFCNMQCGCGGDEFRGNYSKRTELIKLELANIDFSGKDMILSNAEIQKRAYVIGVRSFADIYEQWGPKEDPNIKTEDNIVVNDFYFDNTEEKFQIITINDFDDTHPAGSDVRDYFLTTFLKKGKYVQDFSFMLILKEIPISGEHSFKVIYTLKIDKENKDSDKNTIEAQTPIIQLY